MVSNSVEIIRKGRMYNYYEDIDRFPMEVVLEVTDKHWDNATAGGVDNCVMVQSAKDV